MRFLSIVLATALLAGSASAQQERELFPSDYKVSACAPAEACVTYTDSQFVSAGKNFYGFDIDGNWVIAHSAEMRAAFAPYCKKLATCFATPNNLFAFCDDVVMQETRTLCDRLFPKEKSARDFEQCQMYTEVYWIGVDQQAKGIWNDAEACAAKQPPVAHTKPPDIWVTPAVIPYGYAGDVTFRAIDPDTHVPLYGEITFENQIHYAEANPAGSAAPYYPMKLPFKWQRLPNKEGHTDAAPPLVTIKIPGYPPVVFRLNAEKPKLAVEMTPAAADLKPGRNTIRVVAKEEPGGKSVDARVMLGDDEIGTTNQEITIEVPKNGKRPEIWLKPFLNRYDDVVIAPAR